MRKRIFANLILVILVSQMFGCGKNENSKEELLKEAQEYLDDENYEAAIATYEKEILRNNEIAMINLGYLYANGLGIEKDNDKAEEYYRQSDQAQAKKNLIALWIKDRQGDETDTERRIKELLKANDEDMWEYMAQSLGKESVEELKKEEPNFAEEYHLQLVDFYDDEGEVKLYTPPEEEEGVIYILISQGIDTLEDNTSEEYDICKKFRLRENINIIEHIVRV